MPSGLFGGHVLLYLQNVFFFSQKLLCALRNMLTRFVVGICGLALCLCLIWISGTAGLSAMFADYGRRTRLTAYADRATRLRPNDPSAHIARALVLRTQGDWGEALKEFERAVALRPRDYVLWYELALARSAAGDGEGALTACEQAVRLAPFYGRTHWLLGNLLFRAGRSEEAFAELRQAAAADAETLPSLIDLAWGATGGDARAVEAIVRPQTDAARIALAKYFARKGKAGEAIALFRTASGASEDESRGFLNDLLVAGRYKEAYDFWAGTHALAFRESKTGLPSITDAGFEGVIKLSKPGFGWQPGENLENVQVSADNVSTYAGSRSLRIEFTGNSNPTAAVISQLVPVEPLTRYNLRFAARTEQLVTGCLPQVVVSEANGLAAGRLLGATALPAAGDSWRDYSMEFTTGAQSRAVIIVVNRQLINSGTCPAFGRVWLDEFSLQSPGVNKD
jgi:tetratricopeptide (TPR) repeat protein